MDGSSGDAAVEAGPVSVGKGAGLTLPVVVGAGGRRGRFGMLSPAPALRVAVLLDGDGCAGWDSCIGMGIDGELGSTPTRVDRKDSGDADGTEGDGVAGGLVRAWLGKAAAADSAAALRNISSCWAFSLWSAASLAACSFKSCLRCSYSKNLRRSSSLIRFCSSAALRRCSRTSCRRFSMRAFFCNSKGVK